MKTLHIGIYSPYLDTAGGGEKYILSIAEVLSFENRVDVLLDRHLALLNIEGIKNKIQKLHGIDLSKVNFIPGPFGSKIDFFSRAFFLRKYHYFFYLTDGSIFYSTAKKSIIHFQVPFENINTSWWGKKKESSWNLAIYNSQFTKNIVEQSWNIPSLVIYPPIDVQKIKPLNKLKKIISVGRFFGFLKGKKHELLINNFKELVDEKKISNWSLHLAGGAGDGDLDYLNQLRNLAKGYEIYFYPNIPLSDLRKLYGESSIYWHAMGFQEEDPKKHEHFGISTVEAMAGGCVPVVINLGGQREIVEDKKSGFLWDDLDEFKKLTLELINKKELFEKMSKKAQTRAQEFSKEKFEEKIKRLVND